MYKEAKTRVQVGSRHSEKFDVGVGVHQGLVFSPFFSIVLDILSETEEKVLHINCFMQMTWS